MQNVRISTMILSVVPWILKCIFNKFCQCFFSVHFPFLLANTIIAIRVCKRWKRKWFSFMKNGRNKICWIRKLLLNEINVENRLRIIISMNIFICFLWYFHYYNSSIYIYIYHIMFFQFSIFRGKSFDLISVNSLFYIY